LLQKVGINANPCSYTMSIGTEAILITTTAWNVAIVPPLLISTIVKSVAVLEVSISLIVHMAAPPTLLLVALAVVHAGCTTGLTMHIISTKDIVNCVTLNASAATIALATTIALAASTSPLVLTAKRTISAATIAVSTTSLLAATPSVEPSATRIKTLAAIAIHRKNRAPPLHDRLTSLKLFPR
jgi:hypothetical protein